MKRFQFSLDGVLKVRTLQERKLQEELSQLTHQRNEQQRELAELTLQSARDLERVNREQRERADIHQLLQYESYFTDLKDRIEKQVVRVADCDQEVQAKREQALAMATKKRSLARLRDRHFEEHRRLVRKQDAASMDEVGTQRFVAKSRALEG